MAQQVLSIQVTGVDKVIAALAAIGADVPRETARALYQEANDLMTEAKVITPVDTGALRSSGTVKLPQIDGSNVVVEAGFGGAAAPYALIVHERLDVYHAPPTQAKYLETPFNARAHGFTERITAKLSAKLK